MKKLNKFFAILFAVLGVQAASAQTDVTSTYLTNAGFDDESCWITGNVGSKTTNAINSWTAETSGDTWYYGGAVAYASSLTVNGVTPPATNPNGVAEGGALGLSAGWGCTVKYKQAGITLPAGVYTLSYKAYNANTDATQANNYIGFTSSSASYYGTTTSFPANTWTEEDVTFVLTSETSGSVSVGMGAISGGSGANAKLFVDGVTLSYKSLNDVTEANPVDLTSMASNTQAAWTGATEAVNYDGITMPAVFKNAHFTGEALSQTITGLPAGKYNIEVYCQAHSAWVTDVAAEGATGYTYLCANEYKLDVPVRNDNGATTKLLHTFEGINISSGTLKLSVTNEKLGTNWLSVYVKSITYLGPDKSLEETNFNNNITVLNALSTNDVPTAFVNKINNLKSKYGSANASAMTLSQLVDANAEIKTVLDTHAALVTPYASLKSLISLCTEYTYTKNSNANDATILSSFQSAINTATTDGNAALSVNDINAAYNNLESARRTYTQNAVPVYPYAFDMTFLLGNTTFDSNINGWTKTGNAGWMSAGNVECYNNTFTFSKSLDGLGNGTWEVSVDGFYRYGGYNEAESAHNGGTEELKVKFFANASEVGLRSIMDGANKAGNVGATTSAGVRVPNNPAEGNSYFATGCYSNTVATLVTDGNLTLGLKKESTKGSDWTLFDNFKLVYKGIDVSELQTNLTALISKANGIKSSKMGVTEKTNLTNALNSADATVTVADRLNEMLSALQTAYDAAVASIDTYSKVPAYIAKANKIDASIAANYQTQYNNGTLKGTAETIRQELNVATFLYVKENFKNEIQLTAWGAESNAMWSGSGEHWDGTTGDGSTSYYDANGTNTTHTLSKTVELTPGTYVFRGAGRSNTNTTLSLSISLSGVEPVVFNAKGNTGRGIDKEGNATFADNAQYARDGQGQGWEWEFIKFTLNEKTSVTLTATCKTTEWGWASFANNGLWMDDATYLIANASALAKPMATAQELLDQPMNVEKKTALQEAMDLPATTVTEFNAKIASLETAIDEAKISIEEYKEILTYINKANGINESITAVYQTQYDNGTIEGSVEDVFQALEVATYNYVKDNFTYDVALSDTWNSKGTNTKASDAKGEHWDGTEGTTYKNQFDGWGDPKEGYPADSWSIDFDQEVTLPAGEYIFKVAGRKSEDATLELNVTKGETVLGTVNDFPSGNEALGINKAGVASFDAEDPAGFANDGKGRGWQWRYVKFTLADKSTVKVAVHAETNKIYNWVSFGNYTLQMTEETYMAAGQPELDAALATAQALVGTKPMGTDEDKALNDAIELPVTTGAEQKAKVNALNTAVENIKTWRATYYAEKDKLVAALERFETYYNDAENGSLDYMNKNRWTTVIEKAQAAAVAKDNQTSHAVLTTATNELNEALDAATVSVGEYAALKSVIGEANSLVGANVGDQPFEKPQSAADAISTTDEQAVYDAATADGEGVTSVTDALNKGIEIFNNTPLNAPKDGARYNLVMNNNGNWEHDGKAVTYLANDRVDAGLYNIQYLTAPNANYAQAFTLTAVEGKQDCYYISMTDVEGNERYVCTGVVYGGNASQLRTTTKAEDALAVKVIATKTDGVHNLYNVEASNYIGSQDAGFYTVNSHINFNIQEASTVDVTLAISSAKWSTVILPFNADLPEGVKAYTCAGVNDGVLKFNEANTIKANTPYLVNGKQGNYPFAGYGLADKDTYTIGESQTAGQFTGTYVDYQTKAGENTWVLQKDKNTGAVAFFIVGESAQPWVRANRCYITYDSGTSEARMLRFGFDGETAGIDNIQSVDNSGIVIYDTMGRKVTSMKKGNLYIMNGRKVVVK